MALDFILAPMAHTDWTRPDGRRRQSQYSADWRKTLQDLEREVDHLRGRDVTIELAVHESSLRRDRTTVLANHHVPPPVVVTFESKDLGPMRVESDALVNRHGYGAASWRQNVRAVALTLESLRAAERHGASSRAGGVYGGFKALPPGTAMPAGEPSLSASWALISEVLGFEAPRDATTWRATRAAVLQVAHPDKGGDPQAWHDVERALTRVQRLVDHG